MADRRWVVLCGIAGALLAVALSWDFFALSLDPWPDQAWILLAAERHHRGLGLTTTLESVSEDLAVTDYHRLVYFPPGYPLLLSSLRATGASMETLVKAINGAALVAGFIGWMWLAGRLLGSRAALVLFTLLLVLACRGTIPRGGTTDYVFWALLPFWFLLLERVWRPASAGRVAAEAGTYTRLLAAGLVIAVMIGFRWAAVVLVPAGAAYLLLRRRLWAAALYAAIPSLTFAGISLANRALSGAKSSILSYVESSWRLDLLATLYPFEAAFARPMALEPLLTRIGRAVPIDSVLLRLVIPLIILALLLFFAERKRNRFVVLTALVFACLAGLLAYMTLRHTWPGMNWSYLEEPRYFLPFFPAFALVWLATGESIRHRAARAAWLALLAIGVLYLGQAEARWTAHRLRTGEQDAPLLARLDTIAQSPRRSVVFDIDISRYLLWDSDRFSPRLIPDAATAQRLRTSAPADVWIVERLAQKTAYASDPEYDRKRLDALRARFKPSMVWESGDGRFRLYHAPAPHRP